MSGAAVIEVEVECAGSPGCPVAARPRMVQLRQAAPGVVEFPQLHCASCGCVVRIAAGWPIGVTV